MYCVYPTRIGLTFKIRNKQLAVYEFSKGNEFSSHIITINSKGKLTRKAYKHKFCGSRGILLEDPLKMQEYLKYPIVFFHSLELAFKFKYLSYIIAIKDAKIRLQKANTIIEKASIIPSLPDISKYPERLIKGFLWLISTLK